MLSWLKLQKRLSLANQWPEVLLLIVSEMTRLEEIPPATLYLLHILALFVLT